MLRSSLKFSLAKMAQMLSQEMDVSIKVESDKNEEQFQCQSCEKQFNKQSAMFMHQKMHVVENLTVLRLKTTDEPEIRNFHNQKSSNTEKLFKCHQCLKKFGLEDQLLTHLVTYNDEDIFQCQFCGEQFDNQNELSIHRRIHSIENIAALIKARTTEKPEHRKFSTERTQFDCQFCEETFTVKSAAARHVQTTHFTEKPFKSNVCEKTFLGMDEATLHENDSHRADTRFQCLLCEKYFLHQIYLERHLERHSNAKILIKKTVADDKLSDKPCVIRKSRKSQMPGIQAKSPPKSTNYTQKPIKSEEQACTTGVMSLIDKSNASLEGATRTRFGCQFCEKTFGRKRDAVRHEQAIHFGKKRFKCSYCEKSFTDSHQVKLHEKGYHLGDKQIKCQLCDKTFLRKIEIERHLRTHTGEKPYKCENCDKSFAHKRNLLAHESLHLG